MFKTGERPFAKSTLPNPDSTFTAKYFLTVPVAVPRLRIELRTQGFSVHYCARWSWEQKALSVTRIVLFLFLARPRVMDS